MTGEPSRIVTEEEKEKKKEVQTQAENKNALYKAFATMLLIWAVFCIALWIPLLLLGYNSEDAIGAILTVAGLVVTIVDRKRPIKWAYGFGLIGAFAGVLISHLPDIISAVP